MYKIKKRKSVMNMEKRAEQKRLKWLEKNGFSIEKEQTYVYVGTDSYERKDELKEAGWKYHPEVGWHNAELNIEVPEENIFILPLAEAVEFYAWGDGCWRLSVRDIIKEARERAYPQTASEWLGEKGDMIRDLPVVLVSKRQYASYYGLSNILTFKYGENTVVWFTSVPVSVNEGEQCSISGRIKELKTYRNDKQTVLTRCKIGGI
jgi:hypothetical protein